MSRQDDIGELRLMVRELSKRKNGVCKRDIDARWNPKAVESCFQRMCTKRELFTVRLYTSVMQSAYFDTLERAQTWAAEWKAKYKPAPKKPRPLIYAKSLKTPGKFDQPGVVRPARVKVQVIPHGIDTRYTPDDVTPFFSALAPGMYQLPSVHHG